MQSEGRFGVDSVRRAEKLDVGSVGRRKGILSRWWVLCIWSPGQDWWEIRLCEPVCTRDIYTCVAVFGKTPMPRAGAEDKLWRYRRGR